MSLRHRIAAWLIKLLLRFTSPPLTLEGLAMSTIKERLAALEGRCSTLETRATNHDDALTNGATKADVSAAVDPLAERVTAIEEEIGTDPAPQNETDQSGSGATGDQDVEAGQRVPVDPSLVVNG